MPSYALSKKGNTWVASGKLDSGREFRFECGKGSREAAAAVADLKMSQKAAASKGSKARWAKWYADKAAAPSSPAAASSPAAPPVVPPSTPAPPSSRSHEVWAKLKALGDASSSPAPEPEPDEEEEDEGPIDPDEVIPPGGRRGDDDDEDPDEDDAGGEDDEEAEELISDAIATAAVSATIKLANAPLKKKGRRGEPDDRFRDLEHKGIKRSVEKLVDGHMRLSPGMQILVGALGTVVTVWLNAEDIPGAQPAQHHQPTAATSSSQPAAPAGTTVVNGTAAAPPAAETSLSLMSQIGAFGAGAGTPGGGN